MIDRDQINASSFIRYVEYHPTLDSTNALAVRLRKELLERSPALVLTDKQTAGQGRGRNSWWSSAGALTFSVVLSSRKWGPTSGNQSLVALAAGLAVRNALASHLPDHTVHIKWPNDVLVNDQKICGILCEMHTAASAELFVIGIGINVNNSMVTAPDDVRILATSLFDLTGCSHDATRILISVLNELESTCHGLRISPGDIVRKVAECDRLCGCRITVTTQSRIFAGRCVGIAADGALLVHTESGVESIRSGSVLAYE